MQDKKEIDTNNGVDTNNILKMREYDPEKGFQKVILIVDKNKRFKFEYVDDVTVKD